MIRLLAAAFGAVALAAIAAGDIPPDSSPPPSEDFQLEARCNEQANVCIVKMTDLAGIVQSHNLHARESERLQKALELAKAALQAAGKRCAKLERAT